MSDTGGLEPCQDGQAVQMTSEEKAGFWFRFAVFVVLAVIQLVLVSGFLVHERGKLHRLWSMPGSHQILLMVLAIPTDDYAFGVFAADSADTVERVCARAGAPPDRISAAVDGCALDC